MWCYVYVLFIIFTKKVIRPSQNNASIKTRCFALIANHNSVYLILRSYCKQNFMATTYILRKGRCNVASDRKKLVCLPSMNKKKSLHMMEKSFS